MLRKLVAVFTILALSTFTYGGETTAKLRPVKSNPSEEKIQAWAHYNIRTSGRLWALECSQPEGQIFCKFYLKGFADTFVQLSQVTKRAICGDLNDLFFEFLQEARSTPESQDSGAQEVLGRLIKRNHTCGKSAGLHSGMTAAGPLIDTCDTRSLEGLGPCEQYAAGFLDALLFIAKDANKDILCGKSSAFDSYELTMKLQRKLADNYRLRGGQAVGFMMGDLIDEMACEQY